MGVSPMPPASGMGETPMLRNALPLPHRRIPVTSAARLLLTARNLAKSFGPRLLFTGITLGLDEGDRVGLIGANGSGKSTLLRIFAGAEKPDDGELISRRGLRVGYVAQEDSFPADTSCLDVVAAAVDLHLDEHERHVRAQLALDRANFPDSAAIAEKLSGGWKKRLAIVAQLASEPDLLLLDEPTNHLDIEGILWLEETIANAKFATLAVSHDRRFLETAANRIIELSRSYPDGYLGHRGSYSDFVEKREEFLTAQEGRERAVASGVRREIEWLRRGAKARTTKAKGRIERAHEMMSELADLRSRNQKQGAAEVQFDASGRQTRKLVELKNVQLSRGGKKLFDKLSLVLAPGQKLGLLGPNGSGKSSLIKLIGGELSPDAGTVFRADALKVVVFDQHREQLDPMQTLRRALSPNGDSLVYQGQGIHVSGWAQRFLFRGEQLDLPVEQLSGGERARVLIARLMLQQADVLILDEPTNDLDIPTLDVLESSLESFAGAVILVSHDRYVIDRLSSDLLALDGKGNARAFASLDQWEAWRERAIEEEREALRAAQQKAAKAKEPAAAPASSSAKKRLTWNEQREFEGMEKAIHAAEELVAKLHAVVEDPAVMADHVKSREAYEKLGAAQHEVERLYARWSELESKQS
jgi:ATP-binding cassette subfamily F protein uup